MYHVGPVDVPEGRNSCAFWSLAPSGTAVVFVHGFGGQSVGTWSEFEMRLPADDRARGADVVFYGYDGLRTPAQTSAARLRAMLDRWMSDPAQFVNGTLTPALHRRSSTSYSKLIVVAHSLGAIVTRKALLDAYRSDHDWLGIVTLLLFAPAHSGAALLHTTQNSLSGIDFLLATIGIVKHLSVLNDLDAEGLFLQKLTEHSREAVQTGSRGSPLLARAVVIAPTDKIVANADFLLGDAAPEVIENTDHSTVCKPRIDRLEPLDVLRRFL